MAFKTTLLYKLTLAYLLGYLDSLFVEIKFIKFNYIEIDELKCSADDIDFYDNNGKSLTQVASKCFDKSSCFGLFRLPENNKFVGCKTQFAGNAPYITLDGDLYSPLRLDFTVVEVGKTMEEAKIACQNLGGHLAFINSEIKDKFLERNVLKAYKGLSFWIGGIKKEDNIFMWLNGTELSNSSFTKWAEDEPNNVGSEENCLIILYQGSWKWNDYRCTGVFFSVCEFQ